MNDVKTYRAASMQDALAIVRRELGADAVILHTKHVTQKRFLPFLKRREEVEITAGLGVNVRPTAARKQADSVSPAEIPANAIPPAAAYGGSTITEPPKESDSGLTRAAELAGELQRRNSDKARLKQSLQALEGAIPKSTDDQQSAVPKLPENRIAAHLDAASDTDGKQASDMRTPPPNQAASLAAAAQLKKSDEGDSSDELASKLDALQKMVESLTRSTQFRGADEIPGELFDIYTQLIDADIEDDLARELIFGLKHDCSPSQLHDTVASRALLTTKIESEVRLAPPIRTEPGRRRVVALVGPTGVGKTTTIAKLAANFRLRDGIRMGLVTVDTYRIAAVEQLRTYAEIIDLPMKVVTSPQDMRRALDELAGLDLILIDTAGRSPRDELKIQELKQMLGEADVDDVHLVMSLTASVRSIKMTCEQFKPIDPTALILTKLDEAAGMGSLLSVSREVSLPFSYLTTGQDVPEDIEPANASRIARLVLGQDRVFD